MVSNGGMDGDTESVMVIKKEINLNKAYKKYDKHDVRNCFLSISIFL